MGHVTVDRTLDGDDLGFEHAVANRAVCPGVTLDPRCGFHQASYIRVLHEWP